jgi:hypothetical protein
MGNWLRLVGPMLPDEKPCQNMVPKT